jgi:steroid delta-isomerase-like uncharacterized protein
MGILRGSTIGRRAVMLTALTLVLAVACGGRRETPLDALAQQWLDALNTHDPQQVLALMSPDATYADPMTPRPLPVAELATHLSRIWDIWRDQVYSATTIVTSERAAAVEWQVQQTHQNGQVLPMQGVFILEIVGGRIQSARSYYNAVPYLQFFAPGRR